VVRNVAAKLRRLLQEIEPDCDPDIQVVSQRAADPDGGTSSHHELSVELPRAHARGKLIIRFCYAVHGPSGGCDAWRVDIKGALPEERDALWEVFHPRNKSCRGWSNHVAPAFVFNGEQTTYPTS
jgi:hypothetical protein